MTEPDEGDRVEADQRFLLAEPSARPATVIKTSNIPMKITVGVSVLVVAGLAALASPAVAAVTSVFSSFAPTAASSPSSSQSIDPFNATQAKADADADGLVYLGDGVSTVPYVVAGCHVAAMINIVRASDDAPAHANLLGELVDNGPRDGAMGVVNRNSDGLIQSYTVAPGDFEEAIGERLCVQYPTVTLYNNVVGRAIQPNETLDLRPDPDAVWISAY